MIYAATKKAKTKLAGGQLNFNSFKNGKGCDCGVKSGICKAKPKAGEKKETIPE